jgi:mannose-6-phosphate isomerase-like protein (cupin superfamily)
MEGYVGNIEAEALANDNYRKVLFTGPDSQLVVMTLLPGEEIGEEKHDKDQFFRIEQGTGEAILDGVVHTIEDRFAVVVPRGTLHNIRNTGDGAMKLYTLYTAPQHPPGTIQKTKAEADAAEAHEGH